MVEILYSVSRSEIFLYLNIQLTLAGFDKEKTTMDELLEHFLENEPSVINIQMRTYVDKRDGDARKFKVKMP